jgi:hypothetical protein
VLLACEGNGSRVIVLLDAQPASRSAASALHVRVLGPDGSVRLDDIRDVGPETGWPLRLPLVPEGGDASRGWTVEATLLDPGGASVSTSRVRGRYAEGATREVALCLFDGCAGEVCTDACTTTRCSSCRAGSCADAEALLEVLGTSPRCPAPGCVAVAVRESVCGDAMDDDCDGRIDCLDPDCGCDAGTCVTSGPENVVAACRDGVDNDCDGLVDCGDAECILEEGPENCGDGIDNDCDGQIDCFDAGCCAAPSCDQQRCGGGGLRCCGGRCANTWNESANCGGCGISCAPGRVCDRPSDGSGPMEAAACRCVIGAGECGGRQCVEHGGSRFCNCADDSECRGASVCVLQSGDRHDACNIPR